MWRAEGRGDLAAPESEKLKAGKRQRCVRSQRGVHSTQRGVHTTRDSVVIRLEGVLGTGPSFATVIDHVTTPSGFYSRFLVDRSL